MDWRPGQAPVTVGAPFMRVLDLPPLPGAEEDGRPVVVVAVEPWRPMQAFAGPETGALTVRATVETPSRVGGLTQALKAGPLHRWDEVNIIEVRVEGGSPSSLGERAVLAGGNAVAVETGDGWEIVQFREAVLVGGSVWRLSGLLRGQQGTDGEMRADGSAGVGVGAVAVFLDAGMARAEVSRAERGLPLLWRAGPTGTSPGGAGVSEAVVTVRGVHERPWSPAHLRAVATSEGVTVRWVGRARLYGDVWDGVGEGGVEAPPGRFRVRVLDHGVERRVIEVEGDEAHYAAADVAADFAGADFSGARVAVAQWGAGYGWGVEASVAIGNAIAA